MWIWYISKFGGYLLVLQAHLFKASVTSDRQRPHVKLRDIQVQVSFLFQAPGMKMMALKWLQTQSAHRTHVSTDDVGHNYSEVFISICFNVLNLIVGTLYPLQIPLFFSCLSRYLGKTQISLFVFEILVSLLGDFHHKWNAMLTDGCPRHACK